MQRPSTAFWTALTAGALTVGVAGATAAQGVITTQRLSAALANELVGDAVANCAQKHYAVTAVVVDLDGVRQAMLRGDGAPVHTIDYAWRKAYSAASITLGRNEDSTMAVATRMLKQPPSPLPGTPPEHVTYAAGGVTIRAGCASPVKGPFPPQPGQTARMICVLHRGLHTGAIVRTARVLTPLRSTPRSSKTPRNPS